MHGSAVRNYSLCDGRKLSLGRHCQVMGVLNCTPDSFSGGGCHHRVDDAVAHGLRMVEEGAAVLDVGGESTRPGAQPVTVQEEMDRVVPVIESIRRQSPIPISIDTSKSVVAEAALTAGADIVNDVTALQGDSAMASLCAEKGCPVILMHMLGTPRTMQQNPSYGNVVDEVKGFLLAAAKDAERIGVDPQRIILDPGFGFGKTFTHNALLLANLDAFVKSGYPVLAGMSRKSMIQHALGLPVEERLEASIALAVAAAMKGAAVVRVHDVCQTKRAVDMIDAVYASAGEAETCTSG